MEWPGLPVRMYNFQPFGTAFHEANNRRRTSFANSQTIKGHLLPVIEEVDQGKRDDGCYLNLGISR